MHVLETLHCIICGSPALHVMKVPGLAASMPMLGPKCSELLGQESMSESACYAQQDLCDSRSVCSRPLRADRSRTGAKVSYASSRWLPTSALGAQL
jgi:hypothetical protein